MEKRFCRRFYKRERRWCPEGGVLANCCGGYDGGEAVIAEMARKLGTAQDKHGREAVAKLRMGGIMNRRVLNLRMGERSDRYVLVLCFVRGRSRCRLLSFYPAT